MDATIMPHVLQKLDAIREDQIRELERLDEIRSLLRPAAASPAPLTAPSVEQPVVTFWTRLEWLLSVKPAMWLLQAVWRHFPTIGTILFMLATGQHGKILAYLNGVFGI